MVKRAVDLGMPALALTDHGYMFGVPTSTWSAAATTTTEGHAPVEARPRVLRSWELEEPEADAPDAALHDRVHAQWASDVRIWEETHDLEAVRANRPSLLIKPIFGCEPTSSRTTASRRARGSTATT